MTMGLAIDAQTNKLKIFTIQDEGNLVFSILCCLSRDHLNATMHEGTLGY